MGGGSDAAWAQESSSLFFTSPSRKRASKCDENTGGVGGVGTRTADEFIQLQEENEELRKQLSLAQEASDQTDIEMRLIKQDMFRLNAAYSSKCQESKKLKEELEQLRAKEIVDLGSLQRDLYRVQEAYRVKVQENKRLGFTIEALNAERDALAKQKSPKR